MAEANVEFIVNAAGFARELANQLNAAKSEDDKATALARLNIVLTDIARAAKGELDGDGDDEDEDKKVATAPDCCTICATKYRTNPAGYQNCVLTCNHGC